MAPVDAPLDPGLLASLTFDQREAVLTPEPVVCVLAGAGAGKTRVLTLRVARRIGDGSAMGDHTLVCTFTRKAAQQLRDRLWRLGVSDGVTAGTIHRTALRVLQQHRADHRLAPPLLVPDRRSLLAEVVGRRDGGLTAPRLDVEIGWAKARSVRPDRYEEAARRAGRRTVGAPSAVAAAYQRYEETRRRRGLLDLDDLLTACADTLADDGPFADAMRWRYRHLFVDEMQDVNPAQFRLLGALLGDEPDLFVVGDPHQSVYGWNGADPTVLVEFPAIFPGTRVIELGQNHRSSPEVVAVAAAALGLAGFSGRSGGGGGSAGPSSSRPEGALPELTAHDSDLLEAQWIARRIWRDHRPGSSWSRVAVLARTNAQLPVLADALAAERVPFRMAGDDLGPASDVTRGGDPGVDTRDRPTELELRSRRRQALDAERQRDVEGGGGSADGGGDGVDIGDGEAAEEEPEVAAAAGPDVSARGAAARGAPARGAAARGGAGGGAVQSENGVVLSTFHRAKGLEWSSTYVIGLSEGLVPLASARTEDALAEERRLLYVALTRAEDYLHLSWSCRADPSGTARQPSRWLEDVSAELIRLEALRAPADPAEAVRRLSALRAELRARQAAGAGDPQ